MLRSANGRGRTMVSDEKLHLPLEEVNRFAKRDPQKFIAYSESRYRRQIDEVADQFASSFPQHRIILLSGPSSSGKTTTSHNLDTALEARGISTFPLSLDDFFFDRDQAPLLPDGTPDLESPELVDTALLDQTLSDLFKNGSADFPIFDFKTGKRSAETRHFEYDDHTAIIIEGLHALNPLISEKPALKEAMRLYISIKTEYYEGEERILSTRQLRFIRRIIRDNNFRGCPPKGTIAMWKNVVRGEEEHIRPFRTLADVWIDSVHLYEPMLYRPIAEKLLTPCLNDPDSEKEARVLLSALEKFTPLSGVRLPPDSLLREFLENL